MDVFACRAGADHALDLNLLRDELQPTAPTPETVGALFGYFQPGTGHAGRGWCEAGLIGRNLRSRSRATPRPGLRPLPFVVPWPEGAEVPVPLEAR
ncbi:MAG TPA: hypothetical protein DD490_20635 [Acidobacteria bacterium]|nr:hypothetical protein [Acidobacteriota bacterium]